MAKILSSHGLDVKPVGKFTDVVESDGQIKVTGYKFGEENMARINGELITDFGLATGEQVTDYDAQLITKFHEWFTGRNRTAKLLDSAPVKVVAQWLEETKQDSRAEELVYFASEMVSFTNWWNEHFTPKRLPYFAYVNGAYGEVLYSDDTAVVVKNFHHGGKLLYSKKEALKIIEATPELKAMVDKLHAAKGFSENYDGCVIELAQSLIS